MKTIVTGGSGFIGSHVVDKLVDAGHDVVVVDVAPPHRDDVGHAAVDVLDVDGLTSAFEGADAVFHLAAVSDVNVAADDPDLAVELTVLGTARVWEAARRAGVARSVLASTVWVFGASPEEPPLTERSLFAPSEVNHVYTATKLACEMLVHSYFRLYGQEFTILRYGVPYGPRMRDVLVIPRFLDQALTGTPITLFGDGRQYRNLVYVEDLAEAHVLALGPAAANEVFSLEGSEPVAVCDIVDGLAEVLGRPVDVQHLPPRPGDYTGRAVSNEHASHVLGWRPRTAFRDGLRAYVDWHFARSEAPAPTPPPASEPVTAAPRVRPERERSLARTLAWMFTAAVVAFGGARVLISGVPNKWGRAAFVLPVACLAFALTVPHDGKQRARLAVFITVLSLWLLPLWRPALLTVDLSLLAGTGLLSMGGVRLPGTRKGDET